MANKPNNPSLWSKAKSLARQKFDVYPSAYDNGWAAKYYKSKGGTWRKAKMGMYTMAEGGVNNPGFKALPGYVQAKIKANMQEGGMSNDIPVRRMRTKTVAVSPSGYYKTIEKQKLTSKGERSSSTVRRTLRGLLQGAPRATNLMPNPGEINMMPNPKEMQSPYLQTSMQGGGMAMGNPMMMPVVEPQNYNTPTMDMIDQVSNGMSMFREGGMPDRYKKMGFRGVNQPKRTPGASKSHAVVTKVGGNYKLIRFGQQGVSGSPKKEGESASYRKRRESFKARHAKNIAKGKSSAAYWANKVKW